VPLLLTTNDEIVLKSKGGANVDFGHVLKDDFYMFVLGMKGIKGAKGDPGSGGGLSFEKDGVGVEGSPHTIMDIRGLRADDQGSGKIRLSVGYRQFVQNDSEASVNIANGDTAYREKLRLSTPESLIAGRKYKVFWYAEKQWRNANRRTKFRIRELSEGNTLCENIVEHEDNEEYKPMSGFALFIPETTGVKEFLMESGRQQEGSGDITERIRRRRIIIEEMT